MFKNNVLSNIVITDAHNGILLKGPDVENNQFTDITISKITGTAFEAGNGTADLEALGLPSDIDRPALVKLLEKLKDTPPQARVPEIERSGLLEMLIKRGRDVTGLATSLSNFASTPAVQSLIEWLRNHGG